VRTIVLDTNVLLAQPETLGAFPGAEIIVPDTVLAEIDKLKTARVDSELRFKGREISRILFDLSEKGSLTDGVELPGGGRLRVVSLNPDIELPEGLFARNADDRILAVAVQACGDGREVTLVTNDLNMLLRAQSYGIDVERIDFGDSFSRRFIIRPFQRYKTPLTILAVAVAVFAAVLTLTLSFSSGRQTTGISALPTEFLDQLSLEQQQVLGYLFKLQADPKDIETQRALAILYDQMAEQNISYLPLAIRHYEVVAKAAPTDSDARTDLASAYFRSGHVEQAIQEVTGVLRQDPNHVNANFNLGIFYLSTKPKQYQKAASQFQKVIRLTKDDARLADPLQRARTMLQQTVADAAAAGQPVKTDGGTL
jgi:tetratricopeptide (TPR) repeat protein